MDLVFAWPDRWNDDARLVVVHFLTAISDDDAEMEEWIRRLHPQRYYRK